MLLRTVKLANFPARNAYEMMWHTLVRYFFVGEAGLQVPTIPHEKWRTSFLYRVQYYSGLIFAGEQSN